MSRLQKGLTVIFLLFTAIAAATLLWALNARDHTVAVISVDGETIASYDLSRVTATETFTVGEPGAQNTIRVSPEGIAVIRADCPDQVCVKQGTHHHGPTPIVCLPHHLSIRFTDGAETEDTLDATTG